MKIFFPVVFYLPKVVGGIELYVHHLALGLKQKGYDVKIVVPFYSDDDAADYNYQGLDIIRYKAYQPKGRLEFAGITANDSLANFKKVIAEQKPDVIHFSQLTSSSGISLLHIKAAKESGALVVYTNHLSEFICQRGDLRYMGTEACDGIVTVAKCTACLLQQKNVSTAIARPVIIIDKYATLITGKKNFRMQLKPFVFPGFFTRWHIEKIKTLIGTADVFVSIAKWSNILIQKNGWANSNCVFIPTGLLNPKKIEDRAVNFYDGKKPLRIVFIGRLVPVKGAAIIIEAVKHFSHQVQLDLYGPADAGSHQDYYENCVQSIQGFDNIQLYPAIENEKVVEMISQYDLLCLPSKGNEMAPLIIQESMKAKTPIIGADLPAIKEWIIDGINGLIFSTGDPVSLKNKLQQLLYHPELLSILKNNLASPNDFLDVVNSYDEIYQQKLATQRNNN